MNVTGVPPPRQFLAWYDSHVMDGSPFSRSSYKLYMILVRVSFTGSFALFGLVSNSINVAVFLKQRPMSSSPMVILIGLSFNDLLVCIFGVLSSVAGYLQECVDYSKWSWDVSSFNPIVVARPLNFLTQTTCLVTTFMAIERAISVVLPFIVKTVFTPKRSLLVLVSIFVSTFVIHIPNVLEYSIAWVIRPDGSLQARFDLSHILPDVIQTVYFYVSPVFIRFSSVVIVFVCNLILIWKVRSSKKFRDSKSNTTRKIKTAADQNDGDEKSTTNQISNKETENSSSTKELKLVRMVIVISLMFGLSYTLAVVLIAFSLVKFEEDYHWSFYEVFYWSVMALQVCNSSTNVFIYYFMSSRYKEEFHLLCWNKSSPIMNKKGKGGKVKQLF